MNDPGQELLGGIEAGKADFVTPRIRENHDLAFDDYFFVGSFDVAHRKTILPNVKDEPRWDLARGMR